jgi:hypothetical protein
MVKYLVLRLLVLPRGRAAICVVLLPVLGQIVATVAPESTSRTRAGAMDPMR